MITGAFMAGLHPPEYKIRVENAFQMRAGWKNDPDVVFEVAKQAAEECCIVEQADKHREQQLHDKSASSGGKVSNASKDSRSEGARFGAEASGSGSNFKGVRSIQGECWHCGMQGHMMQHCPARKQSAPGQGGKSQGNSQAASGLARWSVQAVAGF